MRNDKSSVITIKRSLKKTWGTFFARYGNLTPVQIETIPIVLSGKEIAVVSPTASGKTEALIAPIIELLLNKYEDNLSILYLVPTRALANDIFERLEGLLRGLGLSCLLKHGDNPSFDENSLPNLLITTPESFDSLLCRHHKSLSNIKYVIIDEIHLLDNSYRGDQLRCLLSRLEKISNTFSTYVLSATISEPESLASRYLSNYEIVIRTDKREIEYNILTSYEEVIHLIKSKGIRKSLLFCNSRKRVEEVGDYLVKKFDPYPVVIHHAGLPRIQRQTSEQVMKESPFAICIATSTLELGIDIGNINLTILDKPPLSISSLLQRIGRGNRREDKTKVLAVSSSPMDKILYKSMFSAAIEGQLEKDEYKPDLSVVVQQIMSMLFQNPNGVSPKYLFEVLSSLANENIILEIFNHLEKKKWIELYQHKYYASTLLMDLGEKGEIHSNIKGSSFIEVIDISNNTPLGTIEGDFDSIIELNDAFWEVKSLRNYRLEVTPFEGDIESYSIRPFRAKGRFSYLLPTNLHNN